MYLADGDIAWTTALANASRFDEASATAIADGLSSAGPPCRSCPAGAVGGRRVGPEYSVWQGMRTRCGNKNHVAWHRYGGRGIRVCDKWSCYEAFLADVGPRPSAAHTLDRVDNDGNYEPGNVRWALPSEQANNNSRNRIIAYAGIADTVTNIAIRFGRRPQLIHSRLAQGWTIERAINFPG